MLHFQDRFDRSYITADGWRLFAFVFLVVAGCGDSKFGQVSGTVTLDGQPLANATVEFQPKNGSPSYGETDQKGRFQLLYSPKKAGASVGEHTVRISTYRIVADAANSVTLPEKVPPVYNSDSQETREVKPGRQTMNFDIRTDGKKPGP